ncbi:aldehyde ferredoxin oxidoreductase N-terminal domain-containing protein [Actinoplanes sp. NPDC000266]
MGLIAVSLSGGAAPVVPPVEGDYDGPVAALRHVLAAPAGDPPVALVAGTVGGSGAVGTARCAAVGVSPLSGGIAETRAEGPFAAGLRAAGVTGVVLYGRAPSPSVVVIEDGAARIEPAGDLWGLETGEATSLLLGRYGASAAVAVIGPAGERGVPYASVITCRHHPLPRLGFGAVLGERNVKAVVCVGSSVPPVRSPSVLTSLAARYASAASANSLSSWQKGLPGFGVWSGEPGYAPVDGFTDTTRGFSPPPPPGPAAIAACPGCPTDCVKVYAGAGLHQEALAALGGDWSQLRVHEQQGTDPVSATGRLTVNGVAVPPFDPRVQPNLGLAYVVAPIGPRYDIIEHDLDFDPVDGLPAAYPEMERLGLAVPRPRGELDVERTAQLMRLWSGLDALGVCLFASTPTRPLTLTMVEDLVEAVTGRRPDVLALGATRLRLQHQVNQRLGLPPGVMPDLFFDEPVRSGKYAGAVLDRPSFEAAADALREEVLTSAP